MTGARTGHPELSTFLQQMYGQTTPTAGQDGQMPNFRLVEPSHSRMANFSPGSTAPGVSRMRKAVL